MNIKKICLEFLLNGKWFVKDKLCEVKAPAALIMGSCVSQQGAVGMFAGMVQANENVFFIKVSV